jgi:hypothetical protein
MDLVEFEAPASRAALMDRFFTDSWTITENREWFEISGWLKGSTVQVHFKGLKSQLPAVVMAFLGGLASLPERE